jgi:hypothetical protein
MNAEPVDIRLKFCEASVVGEAGFGSPWTPPLLNLADPRSLGFQYIASRPQQHSGGEQNGSGWIKNRW